MSIKFHSNDLPAARAYVANQLASCGYEDEAFLIRNDKGSNLDLSALVRDYFTSAASMLIALWAPARDEHAPARRFPSADANSL